MMTIDDGSMATVGDDREAEFAKRACGSCTACCTAIGVRSIGKLAGQRCPHLAQEGAPGCSEYEARPEACAAFTCLWLADHKGVFGDEYRPDRCGLVLTDDRAHAGAVVATEVWPEAAAEPAARRLVQFLEQFLSIRVVKKAPELVQLHARIKGLRVKLPTV